MTRRRTYTILVLDDDAGGWVRAPGDAAGWTYRDALAAIRAGIPTTDGELFDWDDVRLVRDDDCDVAKPARRRCRSGPVWTAGAWQARLEAR